jgi:DNA replication and repair protein RecF
MAQIQLLDETKQLRDSILMIDDLSSELDWQHQQTVISTLRTLPVQSFISTTNDDLKSLLSGENEKLFHVKHGKISAELS